MADYLLEIGCEEIPARFLPGLFRDLKSGFETVLAENRLDFKSVYTTGSYRRLVVIVKNLALRQADISQVQRGPAAKIALKPDGGFLPPAIGFAKKFGVNPDQLVVQSEKGVEYIFAKIESKGKSANEILPDCVHQVVSKLPLPISMRWGDETTVFIRPVHWVVSLYGQKVVKLTLFGQTAGRTSHGHRFLSKSLLKKPFLGAPIQLGSTDDYFSKLKASFVLADHVTRQKKIENGLQKYVAIDQQDRLIAEVTGLTEWPVLVKGKFDKKYLQLPQVVLTPYMQKHQKYFPVVQSDKLMGDFWVVADNVTAKNKKVIIQGNEQVLKARLEDVQFFWDEDRKQPLESYVDHLKGLLFQQKLGSIYDKQNRLQRLVEWGGPMLFPKLDTKNAIHAARLCKADLSTQLVQEMPDLQGVVGSLYATADKINKTVAQAIESHYWPRFSGDQVVRDKIGVVVGIADRMDSLSCCVINGLLPTGSQDPWGVRRLLNGLFVILEENNLALDFIGWVNRVARLIKKPIKIDEVEHLVVGRVGLFLKDKGLPHDVAQSVSSLGLQNLNQAVLAGQAIADFRAKNLTHYKTWVETGVRMARLVAKENPTHKVLKSKFAHSSEKQAWAVFESISESVNAAIGKGKFDQAIQKMLPLTEAMTQYFEDVMVMDPNRTIRANRLAFLSRLSQLYARMGNIETLVIPG